MENNYVKTNNMPSKNKFKVLIEDRVIPHYRVPFYEKLAKNVDLIFVASENQKIDGLNDVQENLSFRTIRLKANPKSGIYHPDIVKILGKEKPDFYISWDTSLIKILNYKNLHKEIKSRGTKIISVGCDGYSVKYFFLNLIFGLFDPRKTIRTIKDIISKSRTDFFLTYANHGARYLHNSRFVPMRKICVTSNAIETSIIQDVVNANLALGLRKNSNKIIFVGRLVKTKAPDLLIKGFAKILKKHPETELEIIGEGSELDNLKKLTNDLNIQDRVYFSGAIYDDKTLGEHLSKAILFVMPRLGGLGFNSAMAAALPIIYTNADGTEKDMFKNGYNGWYFNGTEKDLIEKMDMALKDKNMLKIMGERSADLIANVFNVDNMLKSYLEVFDTLSDRNNFHK